MAAQAVPSAPTLRSVKSQDFEAGLVERLWGRTKRCSSWRICTGLPLYQQFAEKALFPGGRSFNPAASGLDSSGLQPLKPTFGLLRQALRTLPLFSVRFVVKARALPAPGRGSSATPSHQRRPRHAAVF